MQFSTRVLKISWKGVKDELLVCRIPSNIEPTKSVINVLHNVPRPAPTRISSELNLNDNNEFIYKGTLLEKNGAFKPFQEIFNTCVGKYTHKYC